VQGDEGVLMSADADVVVVGAGSAGCALTRRLVDRGLRVVLLESGGEDTNPAIHDPLRFGELWFTAENWGHQTLPQPYADDRRLSWPRGRVLGGSSSLNAMIWARGAPADYDHWGDLGNAGWSWSDVAPVFRRMEDFDGGASELRGVGGPVHVLSRYTPDPVHEALVRAAQEIGLLFNPDYNSGDLDGISYAQFTIKDGQRHSAWAAYLRPIRDNPLLTVVTGAHAYRLEFDGSRCVGVAWERGGQRYTTRADHEVVVCAGAIESPRLLMLSGIGDAGHLREHGIDVRADLPGVGRNLHDHLLAPVIFATVRPPGSPSPGLSPAQAHLFWRSRPGLAAPDVQPLLFPLPMYLPGMSGPPAGFTLQAGMIRPASRGTIRLGGGDPADELRIDARTLACGSDLEATVAAVTLCRELGAASVLSGEWGAREVFPGPRVDLRAYVRATVSTYHHQVGTCKMGHDEDAVLDERLRVRGVEGLRVADASAMPVITSGNTNAPAILIGERAADFIAPSPSQESG
jgi:choline dehydrogenase